MLVRGVFFDDLRAFLGSGFYGDDGFGYGIGDGRGFVNGNGDGFGCGFDDVLVFLTPEAGERCASKIGSALTFFGTRVKKASKTTVARPLKEAAGWILPGAERFRW